MRRASGALSLIVVVMIALLSPSDVGGIQVFVQPQPAPTPGWDTKANHPNDLNYHQPAYPIAFVKAPLVSADIVPICRDTNTETGSMTCTNLTPVQCVDYTDPVTQDFHDLEILQTHQGTKEDDHLGSDVVSATNPGVGNELWIYLPPNGQVKRLFPRAIHQTQGKIDFAPSVGSVVEPSLSEDGTRIYFSYFQDATEAQGTAAKDSETVPLSGADMYAIDIGPLLSNPLWDPDLLHVTRLTTRTYVALGSRVQLPADRDKDAMNPTLAAATAGTTNYGTVYLHPTEVRTRTGLHLAYVSNKRRLDNSNDRMRISNYNLNLHLAWLNPDGTLGPDDNQFAYYTTTSAMSPTPLREGLAFSYQATTDDSRYWHIQKLDSEGRWNPLTGYGHGDQLFHLGTFCVGDVDGLPGGETKDYFVALKYYNINNESFGSLWKQDLAPSVLGKNTYGNPSGASVLVPRQDGATELTVVPGGSLSHDSPSPWDTFTQNYFGKFSTPRCGGVDELYFAYTQTSANSNLLDRECNKGVYRSHIGYRSSLQNLPQWRPGRPVANDGHHTVIKRTNDDFNLLWPVPIVSWNVRSNGDTLQQVTADQVTRPTPHIDPGEPFAIVGTSALWNTDRRPPECRYQIQNSGSPTYFHPFGAAPVSQGNQTDQLMNNQDVWTQWYSDPFCGLPPPWSILGIAINITGNKTDLSDAPDYTTGAGSPKEAVRLLGVYTLGHPGEPDPDPDNPTDQSFKALIPSHVPFEFQALDVAYGMKLADVRSWHSLKPRETRTDCGGCHQHEKNVPAVPFAGKYAASRPPVDLVKSAHGPSPWSRKAIRYGDNCQVTTEEHTTATDGYPEWAEIRAGLQAYCASCHTTSSAGGNGTGVAALDLSVSDDNLYNAIMFRGFASTQRGALGSQLFWAARGERTDGRPNDDPQFAAQYACTTCSNKQRWGFHYADVHNHGLNDGKIDCADGIQAYADWVFKLGKWIDNHMPRNIGGPHPYGTDWYHPTADAALNQNDCQTTSLRVGWWDDTGSISVLKVRLNDQEPPLNPNPTMVRPNGNLTLSLPTVSDSDWITVEVRDAADNRQVYRKRVDRLRDECYTPPPVHEEELPP